MIHSNFCMDVVMFYLINTFLSAEGDSANCKVSNACRVQKSKSNKNLGKLDQLNDQVSEHDLQIKLIWLSHKIWWSIFGFDHQVAKIDHQIYDTWWSTEEIDHQIEARCGWTTFRMHARNTRGVFLYQFHDHQSFEKKKVI